MPFRVFNGVVPPDDLDMLRRVYDASISKDADDEQREEHAMMIIRLFTGGITDEAELIAAARRTDR